MAEWHWSLSYSATEAEAAAANVYDALLAARHADVLQLPVALQKNPGLHAMQMNLGSPTFHCCSNTNEPDRPFLIHQC
jgi:hypothetical protein